LGNTVDRIAHDQERRMSRIAQTLAVQPPQVAMAEPSSTPVKSNPSNIKPDVKDAPAVIATVPDATVAIAPNSPPAPTQPSEPTSLSHKEAIANQIIFQTSDRAEPTSGDPLSFMPK
jgi:hypothetical protein